MAGQASQLGQADWPFVPPARASQIGQLQKRGEPAPNQTDPSELALLRVGAAGSVLKRIGFWFLGSYGLQKLS